MRCPPWRLRAGHLLCHRPAIAASRPRWPRRIRKAAACWLGACVITAGRTVLPARDGRLPARGLPAVGLVGGAGAPRAAGPTTRQRLGRRILPRSICSGGNPLRAAAGKQRCPLDCALAGRLARGDAVQQFRCCRHNTAAAQAAASQARQPAHRHAEGAWPPHSLARGACRQASRGWRQRKCGHNCKVVGTSRKPRAAARSQTGSIDTGSSSVGAMGAPREVRVASRKVRVICVAGSGAPVAPACGGGAVAETVLTLATSVEIVRGQVRAVLHAVRASSRDCEARTEPTPRGVPVGRATQPADCTELSRTFDGVSRRAELSCCEPMRPAFASSLASIEPSQPAHARAGGPPPAHGGPATTT